MKKLMLATAIILAPIAVMADAPKGAAAMGCDIDAFKAVYSTTRPGVILYWNNATCGGGGGGAGLNFVATPAGGPAGSNADN